MSTQFVVLLCGTESTFMCSVKPFSDLNSRGGPENWVGTFCGVSPSHLQNAHINTGIGLITRNSPDILVSCFRDPSAHVMEEPLPPEPKPPPVKVISSEAPDFLEKCDRERRGEEGWAETGGNPE
ncbi:unnamed protein product [Pleuronectes platessa]|uniref:Uncharacterized protein n=1 Tax=Pleuronectes platessa TaxID=8262 RepID=A0A9N7YSU5_PLEPL|nr:unnamed protein product [Pleuronectes platessa]